MPMVRAMRMLNAIESGTLTGPQLETLLTADPGRLAELNVLLGMRGQARRMSLSSTAMAAVAASSTAMAAVAASSTAMAAVIASSTAMAAVIASSTAMAAVAASSTAMAAVIASSTAMAAVIASSTAMAAVFASSTAKLAVYNSDTALAAIQANPTALQTLITAGTGIVTASTASSSVIFVPNGTRVILLRRWYGSTESDMINWARGSTTAAVGQGPAGGGRNLDTGTQALGCVSGSYTSNGAMPTANNDTANFVSAANGLQRRTWANGNVLNVIYALVGA